MKAIYAFSGDPITYGHIDIIERAAKVFDHVTVGIGVNPRKQYTFNLEERTDMAKESLKRIDNVDVSSFSGLLVDYAYENNIPVVIRGVRNQQDYEAERELHQNGVSQRLGIETFIILAKPELAHVSSSAVKSIQIEQGNVLDYVPLYVKQRLEERISGQYIIGLTGAIGTGKSYVGRELEELAKGCGIPVHNIELDDISHQIQGELQHPRYQEVRKAIATTFGDVLAPGGSVDRKALGNLVFGDSQKLQKLSDIMRLPINMRMRREIYGKKGIILLNAALLAEADSTYQCNNNVILVKSDEVTQTYRLRKRDLLIAEQIERRIKSQYNTDEKREKLASIIRRDGQGRIWEIDNSREGNYAEIKTLLETIVREMKVK
jgi:pantetheine-phosphate adenylyltransferase/dephospho-CoA kinase